jgi:hypothetical protein
MTGKRSVNTNLSLVVLSLIKEVMALLASTNQLPTVQLLAVNLHFNDAPSLHLRYWWIFNTSIPNSRNVHCL